MLAYLLIKLQLKYLCSVLLLPSKMLLPNTRFGTMKSSGADLDTRLMFKLL